MTKRKSPEKEPDDYQLSYVDVTVGLKKECTIENDNFDASRPPLKDLLKTFEGLGSMYAVQLERGDVNRFRHFQARLKLRKRRRAKQVASMLRASFKELPFGQIHVSPTSTGGTKGDLYTSYVTKSDTRIAGPWFDETYTSEIAQAQPSQSACIRDTPRPWQQFIMGEVNKCACIRDINVVVDYVGGVGKSAFLAHVAATGIALIIPMKPDISAILQFICQMPAKKLYILDIPRQFYEACSKKELAQVFSAIEALKNGILFDTRYKGKQKVINSPHVWIFTNTLFALDSFSVDRWRIWNIDPVTNMMHTISRKKAAEVHTITEIRRKAAKIVADEQKNDPKLLEQFLKEFREQGIPNELLT